MRRVIWVVPLVLGALATLAGQSSSLQPILVVRLDERPLPQPSPAPPAAPRGQLAPMPITRLDGSQATAILDAPRPLSLRISEPLPVRDVLLLLVRDTGLSLTTEPNLEGTFAGELTGVTLRQAFDLVLEPHALAYNLSGTAIRVSRRRIESRLYDVNVAAVRRSGEGSLSASSTWRDDSDNGMRQQVLWSAASDAFDDLTNGVKALLSAEGRFALDRKAGVLQVTDYADRLDRVGLYVESVERRLNRQVDIQARVVEVTVSGETVPPVNWTTAVEAARTVSMLGTPLLDFGAFVDKLREQGTVSILASPRLLVMHNEPALVSIGLQDVSFNRTREGEVASPAGDGFALAVTPHITADGTILLSVSPSLRQKTGERQGKGGQKLPTLALNELSTAVRLRDGETLVLPGLRRDRERHASTAQSGLAGLFRREPPQAASASELAVLLTATVR